MVHLQDVRLPKRLVKGVRASLSQVAPQYHAFVATARHRGPTADKDGTPRRRRYWTGVMTLVHREMNPEADPVDLGRCGLGEALRRTCAGRVLVTAARPDDGRGGGEGPHFFVNI